MQHGLSIKAALALVGVVPLVGNLLPAVAQGDTATPEQQTLGAATQAELEALRANSKPRLVSVNVANRAGLFVKIEQQRILAGEVVRRTATGIGIRITQSVTETFAVLLPENVPLMRLERNVARSSLKVGDVVSALGPRVPIESARVRLTGPDGSIPFTPGQYKRFAIRRTTNIEQVTVTALNPLTVSKDGTTRRLTDTELSSFEFERLTRISLTDVVAALAANKRVDVQVTQAPNGTLSVNSITVISDGQ